MNDEDLRALIARASDAEGPASRPPPSLLHEARAVARRRRRAVTVAASGAVAAAVLTSVFIPRFLAKETDPMVDDSVAAVGTGELATHGGPCPSVLPEPVDGVDGQPFGTSTPAQNEPRLAAPQMAWVCQYRTDQIGRTNSGGMAFEWSLTNSPRRIDDALLPEVTEMMNSIAVNTRSEQLICTDDLGPRYALVSAADGDLTGVVVDDYGCQEVRLTDNPFVTAPGDPQEGRTVPGVLTGTDNFAATFATWWGTSRTDVEAGPAPGELRVTCTDNGPEVESTVVSAMPAGVLVVVDSTMTNRRGYLTYTSAGLSGGDIVEQIPSPATYTFPPGEVRLGCVAPPSMDETTKVTVEVVDPNGYWNTSTLADAGCEAGTSAPYPPGIGSGPDAQKAVDDLLELIAAPQDPVASELTAQPAPIGYSEAATQTWIAYRRGTPYFSILVTEGRTSFRAIPSALCGRR